MMNQMLCAACGHQISYPHTFVNRRAKCQKCGHTFRFPDSTGVPVDGGSPAMVQRTGPPPLPAAGGGNPERSADGPRGQGLERLLGERPDLLVAALESMVANQQKNVRRNRKVKFLRGCQIVAGITIAIGLMGSKWGGSAQEKTMSAVAAAVGGVGLIVVELIARYWEVV